MINCQFENGDKVHLRHATVDAIVVKADKVLLVKRGIYNGQKIIESGKWAMPGGYLDFDETLAEGIKREVREETGFEINNLFLFRIVNHPDRPSEDRQNVTFVFVSEVEKEGNIKTDEVEEAKWFDLDNLPSKEDMAFDHLESIELYKKYLKESFTIPLY